MTKQFSKPGPIQVLMRKLFAMGLPSRNIIPRQIRNHRSPLQPILALPIQNILLRTMTIQIQLGRSSNLLLRPRQITIPRRILIHLLLRYRECPRRIHRYKFILIKEGREETYAPPRLSLLKQKEEPTVGLIVHFDSVESEATSDSGLDPTDSSRECGVCFDRGAADSVGDVHKRRARCKAVFGGLNELVNRSFYPGGGYVGVVEEH